MYSLKTPSSVLSLAILAAFCSAPALAVEALPDIQQRGEIHFITGGIGEEETQAMEAVKGDYNLRITSADQTGHFSGNPHIVIRDMQQNELLSADGGPLFYADLPAGRYLVEGSNLGQSKTQRVTIAGGKIVRVRFTWQGAPADTTTN